jgi:hypothetical protein
MVAHDVHHQQLQHRETSGTFVVEMEDLRLVDKLGELGAVLIDLLPIQIDQIQILHPARHIKVKESI